MLGAGSRLGAYEILAPLGQGGMGEVYRARDTKLGRDVALKILPAAFSHDPERTARFKREAQMLAALNHPHIAGIYGFEEAAGSQFLVLELIEGETLATKLAGQRPDGKGLPVAEALGIARQIADALQAAHEKGIIHRDLKPSNIAITADGQVKVLDFGLAKALDAGDGRSSSVQAQPDISASPTITTPAMMTGVGVILGTAAYMAPEQAKGRAADKRSDIWAFGCVLYEMLTGQRAFEGDDVSDTLAAVLRGEPDWTALPPDVPASVRRLIQGCLAKDVRRRVGDSSTILFVLDDRDAVAGAAAAAVPRRRFVQRIIELAAAAAIAFLTGIGVWLATRPLPPRISRLTIVPSSAAPLTISPNDADFAISRDGRRLVYTSVPADSASAPTQLIVRPIDQFEGKPIGGLGSPRHPFISPDNQWIGFFDGNNSLKKVSIDGGAAVTICPINGRPRGATWGPDGTIVFATDDPSTGLMRVPSAGGPPQVVTRTDPRRDAGDHLWPEFLPDGSAILYTIAAQGSFRIAAFSWPGGEHKAVVPAGSSARYVDSGHIVYNSAGTLTAAPFDAARLQVTGPSVPIMDKVLAKVTGAVDFVVSRDGTAAYLAASAQPEQSLVWVTRGGMEQHAVDLGRQAAARPRLSPDGAYVALQVDNDIWVYDLARPTRTRVTFAGRSQDPVWTPDGSRLVFGNDVHGGIITDLFWGAWDAGTQPEPLLVRELSQDPHAWSPDGRTLAFYERGGSRDLWILKLDPKPHAEPFLVTPFNERSPVFSPDGHWLAYTSDESGRDEIYVRPYPGPGGRHVISAGGGTEPIWSRAGKELFYRNGNKVVSIQVQTAGGFSLGTQRILFEGPYAIETGGSGSLSYDVSADGQRFLMMKVSRREGEEVDLRVNVIENWFEELRRLVPNK